MFEVQLARVRVLIEKVGQKSGRFGIERPATPQQIAEFEAKIGYSLPEPYREFLIQVSDGFLAGSLGAASLFAENGPVFHPSLFPLVVFPLRHTPESWNGLWRLILWDELSYHEKMEFDVALYFAARSGPRSLLLVLSGDHRGRVWHSSDWAVSHMNDADEFDGLLFLDCIEKILESQLEQLDSS